VGEDAGIDAAANLAPAEPAPGFSNSKTACPSWNTVTSPDDSETTTAIAAVAAVRPAAAV
jgi:hypothetical protein